MRLTEAAVDGVVIVASATTPLTARRIDDHTVKVATLRGSFPAAAWPLGTERSAASVVSRLIGRQPEWVSMADVFFGNVNPIAHTANALCNPTRIETGEVWSNYGMMTESVCSLMERLDEERLSVARAFGARPASLATHLNRSFGTAPAPLAEMM